MGILSFKIIANVVIGMLVYNMILKAIGGTIIKYILNTKTGKEESVKFRDAMEKKINETKKQD